MLGWARRVLLQVQEDGVGVGMDAVEGAWIVDRDHSQHDTEVLPCLRNVEEVSAVGIYDGRIHKIMPKVENYCIPDGGFAYTRGNTLHSAGVICRDTEPVPLHHRIKHHRAELSTYDFSRPNFLP